MTILSRNHHKVCDETDYLGLLLAYGSVNDPLQQINHNFRQPHSRQLSLDNARKPRLGHDTRHSVFAEIARKVNYEAVVKPTAFIHRPWQRHGSFQRPLLYRRADQAGDEGHQICHTSHVEERPPCILEPSLTVPDTLGSVKVR